MKDSLSLSRHFVIHVLEFHHYTTAAEEKDGEKERGVQTYAASVPLIASDAQTKLGFLRHPHYVAKLEGKKKTRYKGKRVCVCGV